MSNVYAKLSNNLYAYKYNEIENNLKQTQDILRRINYWSMRKYKIKKFKTIVFRRHLKM